MILFRKGKKRRIIVIILIALVILAAGLMAYGFVNFTIGEEILIYISPSYRSVDINYGMSENISIKVSLNNNWLCSAKCNESFTDLSSGNKLAENQFVFSNHKNIEFRQELIQDSFGKGQKIFQYNIECANTQNRICPSEERLFRRTSTITWNYDFSEDQKETISDFKADYVFIRKNMQDAEYFMEQSINLMQYLEPDTMLEKIDALSQRFNALQSELILLTEYWNNDDYKAFFSYLQNNRLVNDSSDLNYNMHVTYDYAFNKISLYNKIIAAQSEILSREGEFILLMNYPTASNDDGFIVNVSVLADRINSLTHIISTKDDERYLLLPEEISSINSSIVALHELFINKTIDMSANYVDIYIAESLACLNDNCSISGNYTALIDTSALHSINDSSIFISRLCGNYDTVKNILIKRKTATESARSFMEDTSLADAEQDKAIILLLLELNRSISNNTPNTPPYNNENQNNNNNNNNNKLSPASKRINSYLEKLNSSLSNLSRENISYADYYSLSNDFMDINLDNIFAICSRNVRKVALDPLYSEPIVIENISTDVLEYQLDAKEPSCCYHNICRDCCANCEKTNPLIMLHGHSFNVKTSAYTSTESFNQMEEKLTNDLKYISIGTPEKTLYNKADLGQNHAPIMMKATYYLASYTDNLGQISVETKTGNIDTYAIGLKEIIDYVKYITGSEKVDIVAHSMGGLVVRRYLQVFNDESIEKLIMIGTPNKGIDAETYTYCKIFGELNECNDMYYDGVFMKKLNDPKNQPSMPRTLIIIGSGCDTNGNDGDGVVSVQNAMLSNTSLVTINGTCAGTEQLHTNLLNIELYPEVYNAIKDFLDK